MSELKKRLEQRLWKRDALPAGKTEMQRVTNVVRWVVWANHSTEEPGPTRADAPADPE